MRLMDPVPSAVSCCTTTELSSALSVLTSGSWAAEEYWMMVLV